MLKITEAQRNTLDWLIQVAYTTSRLFNKNGLQNHAAATAFYFMLSTTPLLLLLAYGAQWLARLAETSNAASLLLGALYEQLHLADLTAMGFIPESGQLAAGGVGLLTLVLASRGLVNAIQGAFRIIFPDDEPRRLVVSWSLPLLIIPIAFLLVGLATGAQLVLQTFAQHEILGQAASYIYQGMNLLLAFGIVWGLTFLAYWRLPVRPPPPRPTALVALLATLSFLVLVSGFNLVIKLENYRAIYGALGGVVFVLIGAFAAWLAFYAWAQCLFAITKVDVAALERLFLGASETGAGRLENYVFGRANRLLDKYGRTFAPGETLITEGEPGDQAYFLYGGRVGLYKRIEGTARKLGTLSDGELFGEMAYLLGEHRTATVVAETEVVVLALPPALLEELMRYSAPLSRRIIGTLCQRLLRMNQNTGR